MNKPWWLWEGAAVRVEGEAGQLIGKVIDYDYSGVEIEFTGYEGNIFVEFMDITPVENPAVMLAPDWATEVAIDKTGFCCFMYGIGEYENDLSSFLWPQCPDHLKGKTWPLPGRK